MMIIEFIGAPGAGKTTLLPTVIHFFESRNYRAYTVVEAARPFARRTLAGKLVQRLAPAAWQQPLLWRVFYLHSLGHRLRFMAQHPRLMAQVLTSQRSRPAAADVRQRQVLPWLFHHMGTYEFLRQYARPDELLLFDEGFIHRVVQLFTSSAEKPVPTQIAAYIDLLPQPDLVIYVQASTAVCEQRIYERGLWQRAQHKEPDEVSQFVCHAHEAVELAVAHARSKQWLVLEVANDGADLTAVRNLFHHQLDQILLGRWPAGEVQTAV
jgi:thymidylate kinase